MDPTQSLFRWVCEICAGPLAGGSCHGGFQPAGVKGQVVGNALADVESHHGQVVAGEFRDRIADFPSVPRCLNGDVQAQRINDETRIINAAR